MSYCNLVNIDADTAPKLVDFIANLLGGGEGSGESAAFLGECKSLTTPDKYSELVLKLLGQHEAVMAMENEGDVEGFFQALLSITLSQDSGAGGQSVQETFPAMQKAVEVLTSKVDARGKLRLRTLVSLFNMCFSNQSKHHVMCAIFKYAIASGQTALVHSYHTRVVGWAAEWSLAAGDKRSLFLLVSDVLEANKESSLALSFFVLYLSAFAKDAALPADAHALAITAVKSAIKSPVTCFRDRSSLLEVSEFSFLFSSPARRQLAIARKIPHPCCLALVLTTTTSILQSISVQQVTGALGPLLELLRIVCSETLPAYRAFEAKHKALMAEHGISSEDMNNKMRLLTFCSLGAQTPNPTYAQVAAALDVPEADVELWAVDAIAAGLLEATMDQFQCVLTITRCAHRRFQQEHWLQVKGKLVELDKKVTSVLSFFNESERE